MTVVEALKILGLDKYDEIEIKKCYRRKIAEIHPDVTGISSPLELEKVKRLNFAYTVLKKSKDAEGYIIQEYSYKNEDFFVWDVSENFDADCERDIYIHGLDYDEDKSSVIKVATGKYYWDPYLEEFDMFLFSINKAATGLVDESIFREKMYDEIDDETRMSMRALAFYRLSGQFIDLDLAFGELFPDEEEYIFKATVTAKGRTREFNSIA
nr:J domain-containing protein [Butyrivibrio sp.]